MNVGELKKLLESMDENLPVKASLNLLSYNVYDIESCETLSVSGEYRSRDVKPIFVLLSLKEEEEV